MRHPSRKTDNVIKNVSVDLQINVLQSSRFIDRLRVVPSSLSPSSKTVNKPRGKNGLVVHRIIIAIYQLEGRSTVLGS